MHSFRGNWFHLGHIFIEADFIIKIIERWVEQNQLWFLCLNQTFSGTPRIFNPFRINFNPSVAYSSNWKNVLVYFSLTPKYVQSYFGMTARYPILILSVLELIRSSISLSSCGLKNTFRGFTISSRKGRPRPLKKKKTRNCLN